MIELLTFAFINLMGAISPGPDFAIVTRYGISGSRRAAFLASLGITAGLLIHVFYCFLGVALFLKNSPILFAAVQIGGSIYLGFLGFKLLFEKEKSSLSQKIPLGKQAFFTGFLTNLLNPKATLFLLSLFIQFVTPQTPLALKIAFGILIPLTAFCWFSFLSYFLTHPHFLVFFRRYQRTFIKIMGAFLLALSLYVLIVLIVENNLSASLGS